MAKRTYGQVNGKVVDLTPRAKGMRGVDPEYAVHTFKEGPLARLMSRRKR